MILPSIPTQRHENRSPVWVNKVVQTTTQTTYSDGIKYEKTRKLSTKRVRMCRRYYTQTADIRSRYGFWLVTYNLILALVIIPPPPPLLGALFVSPLLFPFAPSVSFFVIIVIF